MEEYNLHQKYKQLKIDYGNGYDFQTDQKNQRILFELVKNHPNSKKTYRVKESYLLFSERKSSLLIQAEITESNDFHISIQGVRGYIKFGNEQFEKCLEEAF